MTKIEMFRKIVNDMADLYEKKNSNYGDSFSNNWDKMGAISGLVPLNNKTDRLTNLVMNAGEGNHFESIEDSVEDLACYAVMFLIELRTRENPLGLKNEQKDTHGDTDGDMPELIIDAEGNLIGCHQVTDPKA